MKGPSVPSNLRVYAIGDIHGHADALHKMHEAISTDLLVAPPEHAHIVYLGDYIDRGPENDAVIDILIARQARGDGIPKTFLRGNHELALFEFMDHRPEGHDWLKWGGLDTLRNYGISLEKREFTPHEYALIAENFRALFPARHRTFLEELSLTHTIGDYLFTHAGVDPFKPLHAQTQKDFTAIREPFLSWHKHAEYKPLEKKVVHGHSVEKEPSNLPHRIGVDTGLYKTGILTAAVLQGNSVRYMQVGG